MEAKYIGNINRCRTQPKRHINDDNRHDEARKHLLDAIIANTNTGNLRINHDERDDDEGDVGQVAHDRPKAKECAVTTRLEWLHRQVLRHLLVKLVGNPRHEVTHRADNPANTTQRCAATAGGSTIFFICLLGGFVLGLVVIVIICRLAVISTILAIGVVLIIASVLASLTAVILIILVVLATVILWRGLLLPRDRDSDGIIHLVVRIWLNKDIFHIRRFLGTQRITTSREDDGLAPIGRWLILIEVHTSR